MSWLDGLRHRLRSILRPGAFERDMQEEMRFHLDLETMDAGDADAARRHFGNRTYYGEERRRMTWLGSLDTVRQDARYARRSLMRNPGMTAMIILTLALGLGVNAATFTLLDRLYLRAPGGIADPASVQRLWFTIRVSDGKTIPTEPANWPMYRAVSEASGDPRSFAAYVTDDALRFGEGPTRTKVHGVFATSSYFPVLGVRPALGRLYTSEEDSLGHGSRVAVIGDRFWRTQLGADSSILGKSVRIELESYTVVGVLPPAFTGIDLQEADVWIPIASIPTRHWIVQSGGPGPWTKPNPWGFRVIRRVPSTVDASFVDRAARAVRETNRLIAPKNPDTTMKVLAGSIIAARGPGDPGQDMIISTRLGGVAAIVLIIACANVINLLLARAASRRREIAVRLALGVSRARLVRLLTTETVMLGLIAGGVAVLAASWGGNVLRVLILPDVEWREPTVHWRVVLFAFATALLAGLVAGIIPAWQASRPDVTRALKDGSKDGSLSRSRLRGFLAIAQAALSVTLLIAAALFVRSLRNVERLDIGYDAQHLVFGSVQFDDDSTVPDAVLDAKMREVEQRLAGHSGVESVARAFNAPMRAISFLTFYWGNDSSPSIRQRFPTYSPVSSNFFETAGLRLTRGTTFEDGPGRPRQVVVNETMAKMLWPRSDPIGQCMRFEKRDNPCYIVVGIVANARQGSVIEKQDIPQYYLPMGNLPDRGVGGGTLVVRARAQSVQSAAAALLAELRRAFPRGAPHVQAMTDQLEPEYRPWRLGATLFTAFGLLALVVALVGIYSTVSYGVTQRTHEFGVRVALGARLGNILSLVLAQGVRVAAVGIAAGIALALAAGRLIGALLYGVQPSDPVALISVSASILFVAVLATLIPAWRAARVDPVRALRSE